jgi:hypothetical protein
MLRRKKIAALYQLHSYAALSIQNTLHRDELDFAVFDSINQSLGNKKGRSLFHTWGLTGGEHDDALSHH